MIRRFLWISVIFFTSGAVCAEQVDKLLSVPLAAGLEQRGVLTMVSGDTPATLVMLFPGDPAVLKAEVADGKLVRTKLRGNPFVRARNLLVRPGLATVLVDCRSDQLEQCSESYIMSKERFEDASRLLAQVRTELPGIKKVWIAGHSLGTLSSASLARQGAGVFDGAIHASTILAGRVYTSIQGWDFSAAKMPQVFIHHRDDTCPGTPYFLVEQASRKHNVPLVAINVTSGARGAPCGPFAQHGFAGAEAQLMDAIAKAAGN